MTEDASIEDALAFARTLKGKSLPEQIGQLLLAFREMDVASAKMVLMCVELEKPA